MEKVMDLRIYSVLIFIITTMQLLTAYAEDIKTTSPDGSLIISVGREQGVTSYSISIGERTIIKSTPISITIDNVKHPSSSAVKKVKRIKIKETIKPTIPLITSEIRARANETLIIFDDSCSLRVRAYDDGIAFRWETTIDSEKIKVNSEELAFNFAEDVKMYFPVPNGDGFFSHQENYFNYQKVSETKTNKDACAPILFELPDNYFMLLTDVNVEAYPGVWIKGSDNKTINAIFPHYPAETTLKNDRDLPVSKYTDYLALTKGTRNYPWRSFVITTPENMLTSTLNYSLADECRLKDTKWIKPGKVSWDWWNAWNITDVPFKAGINQDTYKNYIDFASDNGLQYIILDEGWSVKGPENLLKVVPELNIPELVKYAESKNVGVILWMLSVALERNFDAAFECFSSWGIKGLKVDFMQRDDQVMMDFCARVAVTAAEHRMLVDFHGGSKPTGLQRTYPNVITQESVMGLEQSKWCDKANPDMAVLLPFIRMMVGPMDYTPGAMDNFTKEQFKPTFNNPGSQGTRCHQLAMYVTFLSPLQMLADTPTKYRKNEDSMQFLREVPTTWHETRVIKAEVGKVIALARRHDKTWFLSALTGWQSCTVSLPLDFLGRGTYTLQSWSDGPNASDNASDTLMAKKEVTSKDTIEVKLAPGGGYAAILKP